MLWTSVMFSLFRAKRVFKDNAQVGPYVFLPCDSCCPPKLDVTCSFFSIHELGTPGLLSQCFAVLLAVGTTPPCPVFHPWVCHQSCIPAVFIKISMNWFFTFFLTSEQFIDSLTFYYTCEARKRGIKEMKYLVHNISLKGSSP